MHFAPSAARLTNTKPRQCVKYFKNIGYEIVDENDNPDVFVLNSCTVTAESDRKNTADIKAYKKAKPKLYNGALRLYGAGLSR